MSESLIVQLRPFKSIPHALKGWADQFEGSETPNPKAVVLVALEVDETVSVYLGGSELNRHEAKGALFEAAQIIGEQE